MFFKLIQIWEANKIPQESCKIKSAYYSNYYLDDRWRDCWLAVMGNGMTWDNNFDISTI